MSNRSSNHRNGRATQAARSPARRTQRAPQASASESRSSLARVGEDGGSLLLGIGVGIAAFYLLGNEARRAKIAAAGKSAARELSARGSHALSALQSVAGDASDEASHGFSVARSSLQGAKALLLKKALAGLRTASDSATSRTHDLVDSAKDHAATLQSYLQTRATSVFDDARSKKNDLVNRASLALGRDRDHHYVGQTACALGSLTLGAGAFWLLDPRLGRSRRAWLGQKGFHWVKEVGGFFRNSGRYVGGKFSSNVARTKSRFATASPVDDQRLVARIRAELGHLSADASELTLTVRDGWVSLGGNAAGNDIATIANFVLGIRGVRGLDNGVRSQVAANA